MIQYKCENCGGQMEFGGSGGFECPYCGSKSFLSDADFRGHEEFRKQLLLYYRSEAEKKECDYAADTLWERRGQDRFTMDNGQALTVEYMVRYPYRGFVCYLARTSVVYVFDDSAEARSFTAGLRRLAFPEADNKLQRCFPVLKQQIGLARGGFALVFERRPHFYPAELFSLWPSEHLAWVISRMENICCALAYAGLEHGDISPSSVWVNPKTHEGALFGDWRNVLPLNGTKDLAALRRTAITLAQDTRTPAEMYAFLNAAPAGDAYGDFALWDRVIEKGFGGHRFIKFKGGA